MIKAYIEPRYIGHLQDKYNWSDSVVQIIAWKSLSLALRRINRDVSLTKVCNHLLPTNAELLKQHRHSERNCVLCGNSETSDHMIQCKSESRMKWRRKCLSALRHRIDSLDTNFELGKTLCNAIDEWMDTDCVTIEH